MDVMAMCSSTPISNQSDPRKIPEAASTMQNLPSPPLMSAVNEKKNGSSLSFSTSILPSPVSPLHEINPIPLPVVNSNLYHQSSTPQSTPSQSTPSRTNYLPPIDTTSSMWPTRPPTTTNYHQSLPPPPPPLPSPPPPPQYPYVPQSQHQSTRLTNYYPRSTTIASNYLSTYPTSTSHIFTGSNNDSDNDSPYIQQTFEQSLAKMGKVVDYCNQIVHFALQYRDMKINYNPWNGAATPQVTESHLENVINRAYDVLNIVSSLKGEITARPSSIELSQDEIDLIRKQRTLATYTRTKYRKRNIAASPRKCHSCNITETPEWRRGPDGARTLCNACGLHFAKITRNRALSVVQQTEQQRQQQAASDSSNITSTTSVSEDNVTKNLSNNNNSSMQTSSASNVKQPIIEIIDD